MLIDSVFLWMSRIFVFSENQLLGSNLCFLCTQILYNQQSVEVGGNLKRWLITQLQPDTEYSFALTSKGNIAGGLQQQVSIRTAPDLIKTKPTTPITHHQAQGGRLTINLPKVQTTNRVRWVKPRKPQGRGVCSFVFPAWQWKQHNVGIRAALLDTVCANTGRSRREGLA